MKDYKKNWIYTLVFMGVLVMILASCEKEDNNNDNNQTPTLKIPELTTSGVSNITKNSASCGGNIISDGGAIVTIQGVCWSTSNTPTIADNKTTDSTGTNIFTSNLVEITHKTTYYVCAYATNSVGTAYGSQLSFTTDEHITHIFENPEYSISYVKLNQNFPNPFNCTTTITYEIKETGYVQIDIFNFNGQFINSLVNQNKNAGQYSVAWNGVTNLGNPVSSGLYYYMLKVNGKT